MSIESGAFKSGLQAQQVDPSPSRGDNAYARPAVFEERTKRECRTTRLAVQVIRLKGWLVVTEEKCDRKLATPFN